MFRTKSQHWISQIVLDPSILQQSPIGEASTSTQTDFQLLQHFDSLQGLVTELTSTIDDAYLQQSVELSALTAVAPSVISKSTHPQSNLSSVSIAPTFSLNFSHQSAQNFSHTPNFQLPPFNPPPPLVSPPLINPPGFPHHQSW